ncbi:MAG: ABC transporter permease [Planctomycetota bacterium]|nr:ABC transporter permease [Planctomycetota bacterium]
MISSILMIVRRSLRLHRLSSTITVISIALSAGLAMAVFSISAQSSRAFGGGKGGWDAVMGAPGSDTQLVLNTIYHLQTSPGNIPWSMYQELLHGEELSKFVKLAVPYAVGDNHKGYRIVGTTPELFTEFEYTTGKKYELVPNQVFDPLKGEAIIGATVARELGMQRGDKFKPMHGVIESSAAEIHDILYVVISVMKPTNTPADKVIWIPIEGIFRMPGHEFGAKGAKKEAGLGVEVPDEFKEVSAVMIKTTSPFAGFGLQSLVNREYPGVKVAWPVASTMAKLIKDLGWVNKVLEAVAYMVVVVAGCSLLASLYNTMNERRREFAILRALGARKQTVFAVIVAEATTIAFLGALLGFGVYFGILAIAAEAVQSMTGVVLDLWLVHPSLYWTPLGMLVVGALAGLLPAFKAYSTDVAGNLTR